MKLKVTNYDGDVETMDVLNAQFVYMIRNGNGRRIQFNEDIGENWIKKIEVLDE